MGSLSVCPSICKTHGIFSGIALSISRNAAAISARSFLVLTGNGEKTFKEHESLLNVMPDKVEIEKDLTSVAEKIT